MRSVLGGRATFCRGLISLAVCLTAVVAVAAKPFAPGLTYRVRLVITPPEIPGMAAQGEQVIVGHGVALGKQTRLDLDSVPQALQAAGAFAVADYFLMLDSGRVVVVNPGSKTYTEGLPGMGGLPPDLIASATFSGVSVNVEDLGNGEIMQGLATHKYRLTTAYGLAIMGQSMNTSTVQEIWTAQLPTSVASPFDGAIPVSMATGPMKELYDKTVEARAKLGTGAAIKSVTTSSIMGPMSITTTQTVELLDIKQGDVDPALFIVPAGFTKK